ncbi:retrotransposon protein, putative, ty1-copia subclass [Tanacetum coccineum]
MMIKGGKIQKANKKSLKAKGKGKANGKGKDKQVYIPKTKNPKPSAKEHPAKDDTRHHCKEVGHWKRNCPVIAYKVRHMPPTARSGSLEEECLVYLAENCNGVRAQVEAIGSYDLVLPNGLDYALEFATRILNMVPTKKVDKTLYELWYGKVPNLSYLKVWGCETLVKRDTPDKLQQRPVKCIFIGYPKEMMGYYFYFPPENKIVVARYAELFEKNLITQEVSERAINLEEIQDEDTPPSEITSKIPMEVEGFEPPQEEVIPIRRSERTHRAPDRLCLNVEADEHSLKDLNEPTSYKAAINTKDMFLVYGGNLEAELRVDCYCDARFETDRDDTKSQTRYVFILNGGAVDWKSSKQSTTAMSATEAEYIAASEAAMEAVWIRKFISGLGEVVAVVEKPHSKFLIALRMFARRQQTTNWAILIGLVWDLDSCLSLGLVPSFWLNVINEGFVVGMDLIKVLVVIIRRIRLTLKCISGTFGWFDSQLIVTSLAFSTDVNKFGS